MSDKPDKQDKDFNSADDALDPIPKPEQIWPPPEPKPKPSSRKPAEEPVAEPEEDLIDLDWDGGVEKIDDVIEEIRQLNGESPAEVELAAESAPPPPPPRPSRAVEPTPAVRGTTGELSRRVRPKSEGELAQLWSNVFFSADRAPPRAVIVTSARRGDGATQIACGLAILGAGANRELHIALVDFNLRKPGIADQLGITGEPGVTDVLSGGASIDSAMQVLSLDGGTTLHVLPAGTMVDQPLGVIKSRQVKSMIARLKERYDHVLIDVACAGNHPDAQVIGSMVDGALLVVRAGSTPRETVAEAKKRLDYAGVRCLGLVMNQRSDPIPGLVYRMT